MHNSQTQSIRCFFALAVLLLLYSVQPVVAEPRAQDYSLFKQLFENKIEQVKNTRGEEDDIALIKEMEDAAASIPDSPEVQRLIYRSMIDLAESAKHYVLAASSIDLLYSKFPSDPNASPDRALNLLEQGYRSSRRDRRKEVGELYVAKLINNAQEFVSDNDLKTASREYKRARLIARDIDSDQFDLIQESLDGINRSIQLNKQINNLKEQLEKEVDVRIAEDLFYLFMIEKDDPGSAVPFAEIAKNEQLVNIARNALEPPANLTVDDAVSVAEWYFRQRNRCDASMLNTLYENVKRFSEVALQKHTQKDAKRLRITALRDDAISKLSETSNGNVEHNQGLSEWVDLIEKFSTNKHRLGTQIKKSEGKIETSSTDFILDVSPTAGYDIALNFTFMGGDDGLSFSLPVGKRRCLITYSRYKHTRSELKGLVLNNQREHMLVKGQTYQAELRMRPINQNEVQIQFNVNGTEIIKWNGNPNRLSVTDTHLPPEQYKSAIRIACGGNYVFSAIKYKEVK